MATVLRDRIPKVNLMRQDGRLGLVKQLLYLPADPITRFGLKTQVKWFSGRATIDL